MEKKSGSIAVFDSGVGGLTVLDALQKALPNENYVYLGDTARLPYGTKSQDTIIAYAKQAVHTLLEFDIKLLVVACNTASALALSALQKIFPNLPMIGVLQPGAEAACNASESGVIALLATESTIHSHGYRTAIQTIRPDASVIEQPCALFVSIAEEGWADNQVARAAAEIYLQDIKNSSDLDCVLLGCTHFPVLKNTIKEVIGHDIKVVDSATTTADKVQVLLKQRELLSEAKQGQIKFLATDSPERFQEMAGLFLDRDIEVEHVETIRLEKVGSVTLSKKNNISNQAEGSAS